MQHQSQFVEFVSVFCGGQLRLPLARACKLAGLHPQSIKNARVDSRRSLPLPIARIGARLYVNAADLFNFLGGEAAFPGGAAPVSPPPPPAPALRRGAPSAAEKAEAARRGLTVAQLRRQEVQP